MSQMKKILKQMDEPEYDSRIHYYGTINNITAIIINPPFY